MAINSARKGKQYERDIVHEIEDVGYKCERAYASNGLALGEVEACDNRAHFTFGALTIQAKRMKKIAQYLTPPDGVDSVIVRENYGTSKIIMDLDRFLEIMQTMDAIIDGDLERIPLPSEV